MTDDVETIQLVVETAAEHPCDYCGNQNHQPGCPAVAAIEALTRLKQERDTWKQQALTSSDGVIDAADVITTTALHLGMPPDFQMEDVPAAASSLQARVEELTAALERAYEFLGMTHLPDQESSVPGRTTCPVCVTLDIVKAALSQPNTSTTEGS